MSDLRERILAEIERQEKVANEATPGPWEHVDFADPWGQPMTSEGLPSTFMGCGSVITEAGGDVAAPNGDLYPRGGYSPDGDMRHIALHNPATVLCGLAEDRDILARHVREGHESGRYCAWCVLKEWPCPEVLSLARRHGIEVA